MSAEIWTWCVTAYDRAGVADICLSLQDEDGQNVPLLLWAAWLASEGVVLDESLAGEAVGMTRIWSESLISPLRQVRRRLKTELTADDEDARLPLRQKIKGLELEAERTLLQILGRQGYGENYENTHKNQNFNALMTQNLQTIASAWGAEVPKKRLLQLAEALSEGGILSYNAPVQSL
ncbi:MAG: TIGR02444 family protein [Asticcacaulis sp.]